MEEEIEITELKRRVEELESKVFKQKIFNIFIDILMIFIGMNFAILFKKIGI